LAETPYGMSAAFQLRYLLNNSGLISLIT